MLIQLILDILGTGSFEGKGLGARSICAWVGFFLLTLTGDSSRSSSTSTTGGSFASDCDSMWLELSSGVGGTWMGLVLFTFTKDSSRSSTGFTSGRPFQNKVVCHAK